MDFVHRFRPLERIHPSFTSYMQKRVTVRFYTTMMMARTSKRFVIFSQISYFVSMQNNLTYIMPMLIYQDKIQLQLLTRRETLSTGFQSKIDLDELPLVYIKKNKLAMYSETSEKCDQVTLAIVMEIFSHSIYSYSQFSQ